MSVTETTPQGPVPAIGIPDSQDYPRLVFTAPYFETVPLAELIAPAVTEAVEAQLPSLVPPFVDQAAQDAVNQLAVLLAGSTMQGPLYLNPVMPTQPSQAASMAYVDSMIATAGIPEVPPTPIGQVWARETGQWVPISQSGGTYLPLGGGTMQGQINMSGNAITNLPALPVMPNGAAPAQWVLQQISATSLYQGTWNMDTYTPDLTQLSTHVNAWTWIAITTSPSGVVIGPPIPGLQGQTVFNGDTVIYSATAGAFQAIHSGGLTLAEANALYLSLNGGQLSGPLLLNANATQPTQAVTLQQLQGLVAGYVAPDAPTDGQGYLRVGATQGWTPGLPLTGGVTTGAILLSGNATNALQAVPYQQLVSYTAGLYLPTAGGTMVGPLVLAGNASAPLNPVTLTQLTSMLGSYLPLAGGTLTGPLNQTGAANNITTAGSVNANGGVSIGTNMYWIPNNGSPEMNWTNGFYMAYYASQTAWAMNSPGGNLAMAASGYVTISDGAGIYNGLTLETHQTGTDACPLSLVVPNDGSTDCFIRLNADRTWGVGARSSASSNGGYTIVDYTVPTNRWAIDGSGVIYTSNQYPLQGDNQNAVGVVGAAFNQMAAYAYNNGSDPRQKRDVAPAPAGALEKVNAIPVINYRLKEPTPAKDLNGNDMKLEGVYDKLRIGFSAVDIHEVHPDAVTLHPDDGQPAAYSLSDMQGLLWQAVQELTAKVEALEAKAAA